MHFPYHVSLLYNTACFIDFQNDEVIITYSVTHSKGDYLKSNDPDIFYETSDDRDDQLHLFPHGGILNIESFNGVLSCLPAGFSFIDIVLQLSVANYPIAHFVKM